MGEILPYEKILWAVTMLLAAGLAALLLYRKNYKAFPVFFVYILAVLMQNLVFVVSYRLWGFNSRVSVGMTWGTQLVVVLARGLAVGEIWWRVLRKYQGIWALAWRLLVASGALVLLYAVVVASFDWRYVSLNADRGLELAITVAILMLLLFAHYYEVEMEPAVRSLAIGFFLYSCFLVLNDTFLERWKFNYGTLWNLLGTLAYLASMLLWGWALRRELPERTTDPLLLPEDVYRVLAPEINLRLRHLNDQLTQFWNAEAKRP
jgi:hypothetical protein